MAQANVEVPKYWEMKGCLPFNSHREERHHFKTVYVIMVFIRDAWVQDLE